MVEFTIRKPFIVKYQIFCEYAKPIRSYSKQDFEYLPLLTRIFHYSMLIIIKTKNKLQGNQAQIKSSEILLQK